MFSSIEASVFKWLTHSRFRISLKTIAPVSRFFPLLACWTRILSLSSFLSRFSELCGIICVTHCFLDLDLQSLLEAALPLYRNANVGEDAGRIGTISKELEVSQNQVRAFCMEVTADYED